MLTSEHVRSTDRMARFVGLDAYEVAGGNILRDLFNANSSTFLTDQPFLAQLAMEGLERKAEPAKAEGGVETSLDASVIYNGGYGRIYPQTRELTEDEQTELSALGENFDELQAQIEAYADGDPAIEANGARLADIEQRITAIQNATKAYKQEEQALAGCLVYIDQFGAAQFGRGYVKPEDREALKQLQHGELADNDDEEAENKAPALSTPESQAGYSAALVEELTAIRTAAMRVELANRPAMALAALLYPLVGRIFHKGYVHFEAAVEVSGQRRELAPSIKEPAETRALGAWLAMTEAWGDTLPGQPADLLTWLLDQSTDKLLELLAFVTATNLNAVKAKHE